MQSIILLGYMCVGKTTVGRPLAQRLGGMFYDLDWYIAKRYRRSVPQIFAEDGEAKFRDLERRMLHECAEFEDTVLALGGGTPCFFDNMAYINSVGRTFYLKASVDTIVEHLRLSKGERPLLTGKSPEELRQYVATQLAERERHYAQAQHTIDVNVLDSFEKIDLVVQDILDHIYA